MKETAFMMAPKSLQEKQLKGEERKKKERKRERDKKKGISNIAESNIAKLLREILVLGVRKGGKMREIRWEVLLGGRLGIFKNVERKKLSLKELNCSLIVVFVSVAQWPDSLYGNPGSVDSKPSQCRVRYVNLTT
uniref:Uncharacterized protein n=1 Tax=Cacopsylla melanoneura TaxID=428564 RepID=A0A8D8WU86_9HEMI